MKLARLFGFTEPVHCCKADRDVGSHRLSKEKNVELGGSHLTPFLEKLSAGFLITDLSSAELNLFQFFDVCYKVEMPERTILGVSAQSRRLPTKWEWEKVHITD